MITLTVITTSGSHSLLFKAVIEALLIRKASGWVGKLIIKTKALSTIKVVDIQGIRIKRILHCYMYLSGAKEKEKPLSFWMLNL